MGRAAAVSLSLLMGVWPAAAQSPPTWREPNSACLYALTPQGSFRLPAEQDGQSDCPSEPVSLNCLVFDRTCITRKPPDVGTTTSSLSGLHFSPTPWNKPQR